jgi:hypothetical protein
MHWAFVRCGCSYLTHPFFLGRPRLLFLVGLYDSVCRGQRLRSIRFRWLKQLSLYILLVSLRLFTFAVFLIVLLVNLSYLVAHNVDHKDRISAS